MVAVEVLRFERCVCCHRFGERNRRHRDDDAATLLRFAKRYAT